MPDPVIIGRLHRIEDKWVLVIVDHDGQDIRATFSRDQIEVVGEGSKEVLYVKEGTIPAEVSLVRNRHTTPVLMSPAVMEKIVEMAKGSSVVLGRP